MFCPLRGPRSNDIPVEKKNIPSTQILISNTILQLKEPGQYGGIASSRTGPGNIQDLGASFNDRKKVLKQNK